jgi:putative ABC transport system permease protein
MTILRQGGRSGTGTGSLARNLLAGGEVAMATMLLIGAGLLVQTLMRVEHVRLGFRPEGVLTFQLSPPPARYAGISKAWPFYRSLIQGLEQIPGSSGAAISSGVPMGGGAYTTTPAMPVGPSVLPQDTAIPVDWRSVSPGYFRVMDVPLLRGRSFTEHDDSAAPPAMIVSSQTARRFWGDSDPIGRVVRLKSSGLEFTVVGVAGDVRNATPARDPAPAMYFCSAQRLWPVMDVALRVARRPEAAVAAVRRTVHEIDAEMPVANVRTMEQWVSAGAAPSRVNAMLLAAFAAMALLIAAIGVYGVMSYSVNRRVREIGLRMALGAQQGVVLRLVIQEGMMVSLAGIAVGLAAAFSLKRALASLLFGIEAHDPATFAMVAATLALIALAACFVPAWRAARIDPVVALREE